MSRVANKLIAAAAGNADEVVYVDDLFSTFLYEGNAGTGPEASIDNLTTNNAPSGGLACDNAGTAIAAVDNTTYAIKSAILSTPYDITSAGTTLSFDPTSTTARVDGIRFNPTGTKLYANNGATDTIYQFSLSTAFDVSTASYDSVSLDMSTEMSSSAPRGMAFSADGTTLAVVGAGSADGIYRYTLTTGFDLSTASYEDFFSTATQAANPYSMEFNGDGTKMFVLQGDFGNPSGMPLYQYSLSTAYDTSTASYDSVSQYIIGIAPANHTGIYAMAFWRDGTGLVATSYPGSSGTSSQTTSASFVSYDITTINATKRITNGIDLDGEGGLVWTKSRENTSGGATAHTWIDTERGKTKWLYSDGDGAEQTNANLITAFNSDGYAVGTGGPYWTNDNGYKYASWTFRKQPGFFDVVTYSGTGSAQNISHNLGSVPGMIIVKRTSGTEDWIIYHRSTGNGKGTGFEASATYTSTYWNSTTPTDSVFTVGTHNRVNTSGYDYVAYLFAHDAQDFGEDEDEAIIKCGSYTTDSSGDASIDLGFEPQFILAKRSDGTGDWFINDVMRGIVTDGNDPYLVPNSSAAENSSYDYYDLTSTGFNHEGGFTSSTYIYMAIRRPHKPASEFAATDLFDQQYGTVTTPVVTTGFPVDFFIERSPNGTDGNYFFNRLTGKKYMQSNSANAESTGGLSRFFDFSDGVMSSWGQAASYLIYSFRRAPGFFDVVAYTGTGGSTNTINHNLGVVPEMMLVKRRDGSDVWWVYHKDMTGTPHNAYMRLDATAAVVTNNDAGFGDTAPTATQFTVGGFPSGSGQAHIAYLFATVAGISKVGTYSGTGSAIDVDCGFSNGARFVLLKRTDDAASWYLFDSERGIVAGNDSKLNLDTTAAQTTNTDYIDPLSSGFTITSTATNELNQSGGTYIFYAIA